MSRKLIHVLILEDDFEAVSELLLSLRALENKVLPEQLLISVYTDYKSVENIVNKQPADTYDVILLDRDCILGGSFHVLDFKKFGVDRIISISSTPQWNEQAKGLGVKRIVPKSFSDLPGFAEQVAWQVEDMVGVR